jgi:hypothetical protein
MKMFILLSSAPNLDQNQCSIDSVFECRLPDDRKEISIALGEYLIGSSVVSRS